MVYNPVKQEEGLLAVIDKLALVEGKKDLLVLNRISQVSGCH